MGLGAWGCGAFGNPPDLVARLFREQLSSPEFRGAFSEVVFAIVDPTHQGRRGGRGWKGGGGNFEPFWAEITKMDEPEGSGTDSCGGPVGSSCAAEQPPEPDEETTLA